MYSIKFCNETLAKSVCHMCLDGISDKLFLLCLRPDENVIVGKAHNPFKFLDVEHPHADIFDSVQIHKMFNLYGHRTVAFLDMGNRTGNRGNYIRRLFIHPGNESKTGFLNGRAFGLELRIDEVMPLVGSGNDSRRFIDGFTDIRKRRIHNPRRARYEIEFRVGGDGVSGPGKATGLSGSVLVIDKLDRAALSVEDRYDKMMVFGRDGTCRAVKRNVLAFGLSAVLFRQKRNSGGGRVLPIGIFASGDKFDEAGIDALESFFRKRFFSKDRISMIVEVKDLSNRLPRSEIIEEIAVFGFPAMRRLRKDDGEVILGEDTEVAFPRSIGSVISGVEDSVLESVTASLDFVDPADVILPCVLADRFPVLVKITPHHKFTDIFYLNVIRSESVNIAEEMLCQRPTVGVARQAAFGSREISTFQGGPQDEQCVRIVSSRCLCKCNERTEVERSDVFCEMHCFRMVCKMRSNRVGIVVDAGDNLSAFFVADIRTFNAGTRASGAAEEIDIEEFLHLARNFRVQ